MQEENTLLNIVFRVTIMSIGTVGNVMVIVVILRTRNMHSSTNIFLANLAIADVVYFIIAGIKMSLDIRFDIDVLAFSEVTCKGVHFVSFSMAYASVLTILAIGFDRYYAICQPLKAGYICTKKRAYRVCLVVWAFTAVVSGLRSQLFQHRPGRYLGDKYLKPECKQPRDTPIGKTYYVITTLAFFFLPLLILIVLFIIIRRNLKAATVSCINTATVRQRRQVVKMLATVVLIFFLCYLPYRVFSLFYTFWRTELQVWLGDKTIKTLLNFCRIMVYTHSAMNPIVYVLMSEKFREGFKRMLCDMVHGLNVLRCCLRKKTDTALTQSNTSSVEERTRVSSVMPENGLV